MNNTIEKLVRAALEKVRQNITDHVFLEIQRNTDLFRDYVRLVAKVDDEAKFGDVNSHIALSVEKTVNGIAKDDCVVTPMSSLIQSFTCFKQDTVEVKAETK